MEEWPEPLEKVRAHRRSDVPYDMRYLQAFLDIREGRARNRTKGSSRRICEPAEWA
jgi:hypothetical protein